ncbi:putative quinol monooxygenase [Mucilaginibacter sp. cycad4]|uniref:putative quinol monooxygenase n=1 Tax=Mucilaginibacter sp. cycad4 TaxID=3342096 RepID=UPI002AABA1EB|nr:putative quinol monooxygenase [Mucilaginibacter gossypii]WPU98678.1 putative quinol monooxygenase [Mucilaginibacter gossypii]
MEAINVISGALGKHTRTSRMPAFGGGLLSVLIIFMLSISSPGSAVAQDKNHVVRIAKLVIDSAQLQHYMAALKEHAETAVRVEPGVLTLYAVAEKNNPIRITVFEIYADAAAYQAHLQTAHFKKYKSTTKDMVKSLELVETVPIVLAAKPHL